MTAKEFSALRERCFNLVKEELKKNYNSNTFDHLLTLMLQHRMLPDAPLIIATYQGIIGYHNWLQQEDRNSDSFMETAMHDLIECTNYKRNDGYDPRTSGYLEYYNLDCRPVEVDQPDTTVKNPNISAYYFPETRLLLLYADNKQVVRVNVDEEYKEDYWHGFQHEGADYDVNLFQPDPDNADEPYQINLYPVEKGVINTSCDLTITFRECRSKFRIGDKVRFTEDAIRMAVERLSLDDLWAETHREKEYEVLDIATSPEYDHIVVTVRHTAEDDSQNIAEYNLTTE